MKIAIFTVLIFMVVGYTNCSKFDSSTSVSAGSRGQPLAKRCQAPTGISASPKTIEEAVALINALPKPVDAACFVESLERPLRIFATDSASSAQPAAGTRSPRIFIFSDKLIMSVVPDGLGRDLLEFSWLVDDTKSIKGELQLPIKEAISQSLPYDTIRFGSGTTCGLCHFGESQVPEIKFTAAFVSRALKPRYKVELEWLRGEYDDCNEADEPERCAVLNSIFSHGPVRDQEFPSAMPSL